MPPMTPEPYEIPDKVRVIEINCSATQREFIHRCMFPEDGTACVGTGGGRGSGKSKGSSWVAVLTCMKYPRTRLLLLRRGTASVIRNYKHEIDDNLYQLRMPEAAKWIERERKFRFPRTGSELMLGYIDVDRDYEQYQGIEYTRIGLEEATQHKAMHWDLISASLRSRWWFPDKPDGQRGCQALRWISANPGGLGHQWVKERFVTEASRWPGHYWIPANIWDCPMTLLRNPNYIRDVLGPLPDWKRKQWLEGDWDAIAGNFFDVSPWTVKRVGVPRHAEWYGAVDWGRAAPFAVLWVAVWKEFETGKNSTGYLTRDRMHVVEEVYAKGLALDEQALAALDKERVLAQSYNFRRDRLTYYADWSVDAPLEGESEDQGSSKARVWSDHGFHVNAVTRTSRGAGWELIRMLLRPRGNDHGVLTIDPRCTALLNEMRNAAYSETNPDDEDMAKGTPDHALDALRYVATSIYGLDYSTGQYEGMTPDQKKYAQKDYGELTVKDLLRMNRHPGTVGRSRY